VVAVLKLACTIEKLHSVTGVEVLLGDVKFGWEMRDKRRIGRKDRDFQYLGSRD
tara:strand:- start:1315 stop:1476 length:162 start_codon:yes stop_codon:yes gene_type:complete